MSILEPGQWKVRDLVMGKHTPYRVLSSSNTSTLANRSNQSRDRPHAHGSMVGSEWANQKVFPIRLMVDAPPYTESAWLDAVDELTAAFKPVGSSGEIVELYRNIDGREYVWFGRTRMVEPDEDLAAGGYGFVQCSFVAPDPRRYSAALTSQSTGLPVQQGGLTVPLTAPVTVTGKLVGGRQILTNDGTAPAPVTFRIDGPAPEPRIVLTGPDGIQQVIDFNLTLREGQWLDVDSTKRTAFLNGLRGSNQRGRAEWTMRTHPLDLGVTTMRFFASDFEEAAELTAEHRSAWW